MKPLILMPAYNEAGRVGRVLAGVRAAVLTGAGSAFCSGGNVAEMRDRTGMFGGSPEQIAQMRALKTAERRASSTPRSPTCRSITTWAAPVSISAMAAASKAAAVVPSMWPAG